MKPSLRFPVCLGVWCALLAVLARPDALRSQDAIGLSIADLPPVEFSKQVYQANPGPWGDLEYYYTYLEAPDSLIDLVAVPSQQTVWRFMGKTPEEVKALFNDLQLDDRLLAELVERSIWYINDEEVRVHPTADAIVNLPMPARQSIFAVLRQWEENPFHRAPVIIESANVREWFADTGLSPEVAGTIESLSYKMGRSLAFSDVPYVLGKITTDAEERSFMKALTRTRSLILRLKVSPRMDFEQVADYWTAGYKNKDILPILESVLRTQGVERLDVAHLLPPTPRKHLYTYPPLSAGMSGRYPDCFWTSLNFFEFWPKDRYSDPEAVDRYTRSNFDPVKAPYQFGDMILIINPESQRAYHSCIYLADDIVYTKNGEHILRPWILMKFGDLMSRYAVDKQPVVQAWRKRKVSSDSVIPSVETTP